MRFNKLDLNLLVALDALLNERNVSRAAERMHLSQSAMSNALAKLREYFDDELLVQVGRQMELTARAAVLMEPVRDILVRINASLATQPQFDPSTSDREFRIIASDYTITTLMPAAFALADQQRATVRFQLLPQISQPGRALDRGEADVLIIPQAWGTPDHPSDLLMDEVFVCVAWSRSRIAKGEMSFDKYIAARHVVMQPVGTDQPAYENWFAQRYGLTRRIAATTYSFPSAAHLVVGTEHLTTIHSRLARLLQQALPIRIFPVPLPMPSLGQCMQWHKHRTLDPGIVWLRQLLHEAVVHMDKQWPASESGQDKAEAASHPA